MTGQRRIAIAGLHAPPTLLYATLAVLGLAGLAIVCAFDPRNYNIYPICPFFGLTGYHCPGCGTLRALHQLLRGNVLGALGFNVYTMLALPCLAYAFAAEALRAFRLPAPPAISIPQPAAWALLSGIIAFWVLRNIPLEPFPVLAP